MNKIPLALAALLLCFLVTQSASAQIASSEAMVARQEAAEAFIAEHGPHWAVRLSDEAATPLSIFVETPPTGIFEGRTSIAVPGAAPEAKALRFVERYAVLFGFDQDKDVLEVASVIRDAAGTHVRLRQKYGAIPVFTGDYNVTFNDQERLTMVSGRFFPGIAVNPAPSLLPAVAIRAALSAVGLEGISGQILDGGVLGGLLVAPKASLTVYPSSEAYALAFEVLIEEKAPYKAWRVMIDARNGASLLVEDVTQNIGGSEELSREHSDGAGMIAPFLFTGTGSVYADNGGDASPVTRNLTRLDGSGFTLNGTYTRILNEDASPAYSATSQFFYAPSDTHFDEVNVYYHLNEFAGNLPYIGSSGLGYSIPATVHYGANYGNAFFSPGGQSLAFGDGDGVIFRDLAKENDVIYHEFTHAIQNRLGIGYTGETISIQEGTSDYLAASFANNPRIGQWVTICTDTGDLRRIDNSKSYFNYVNKTTVAYARCSARPSGWLAPPGSAYAVGMIWSGALWDFRTTAGASVADGVVIRALQTVGSSPGLPQGRDAMIQADNAINGGANVCGIRQAFADRGLGTACTPPPPTLQAYISGNDLVTPKRIYTYSAVYSGGSGAVSYLWYYRTLGSSTWSSTGSTGSTYDMFVGYGQSDFELRVDVTRGGETVSPTITVYYGEVGGGGGGPTPCVEECLAGVSGDQATASAALRASEEAVEFGLNESYPNPTRGRTTIGFSLSEAGPVQIAVFDVLGRQVTTVVDGNMSAGRHEAILNVSALDPGIYLYRLTAGAQVATRRMIVAR